MCVRVFYFPPKYFNIYNPLICENKFLENFSEYRSIYNKQILL
jgi:hypothetical protein